MASAINNSCLTVEQLWSHQAPTYEDDVLHGRNYCDYRFILHSAFRFCPSLPFSHSSLLFRPLRFLLQLRRHNSLQLPHAANYRKECDLTYRHVTVIWDVL